MNHFAPKPELRLVSSHPENLPPPSDLKSEQALLGSLLSGDSKLEDTDDLVDEEMFTSEIHAAAYHAAKLQRDDGQTYGILEVLSMLRASGQPENEVQSIVEALRDNTWTIGAKPARTYAEAVRRAWLARQAREVATKLGAYADHGRDKLEDAIDEATESLCTIARGFTQKGASVSAADAAVAFAHRLAKPPTGGLCTGLVGLDTILDGLMLKQTSIVAARTSVGKSALSLQAALNIAVAGNGVLYLSFEMTPEVLMGRAVSHLAQIDGHDLRARRFDASSLGRTSAAIAKLRGGMPLVLNASQSMGVADILSLVTATHRDMQRQGQKLHLVVVDHIGLVKPSSASARQSREQQVAEVSRSLRGIAERFDCHVSACCQVNRAAEQRKGAEKRPQLHDLRDSGAIEQDADVIILIHRPRDAAGLFLSTPAEIVVAKNRVNGGLGTARANFAGAFQTFTEVAE